ncbi:hypothetical protein [Streptomyces flaveus]|uniref:hypothetical protein n=1 Tax=Streptomyces flaveus TaxID=66370 RepID=UPI00331D66A1
MTDFLSSTARRIAVVLFTESIAVAIAALPSSGSAASAYATPSRPVKVCGAAQAAGKQFTKGVTPVLFVHGFNSGPAMWTGDEAKKEEERSALGRVDLSRQRITVNGMGPLKIGMSRAQAEKAIGARIPGIPDQPEPFGRPCRDLPVMGGPKGLFLRFSRDELVAIRVSSAASTSISTASGIHRGSPRSTLLQTYAAEITTTSVDDGNEELLFEPSAPKFEGRVIQFSVKDGTVDAFAAGEPFFADNLDCSSD